MFKVGKSYKFYHTSGLMFLKCVKRENGRVWFEYNHKGICGQINNCQIRSDEEGEFVEFNETYHGIERLYAMQEA